MKILRLLLVLALFAAGCSSSGGGAASPDAAVAPLTLAGVVQSGGRGSATPLAGVPVRVFRASAGAPVLVGQAVTDAAGRFLVAGSSSPGYFYATADVAAGVVLAAGLGDTPPPVVTINEATTVAASYALARFTQGGGVQGGASSLLYAFAMVGNLANRVTGDPSDVLLASPNADQTNSLRSFRTLANLLAGCVQDPESNCPILFGLTTRVGRPVPADTWQALVNLAHDPGRNVDALFLQAQGAGLYQPALAAPPDSWALAVKVNDSGDDAFPIGGPGNTVFHPNGTVWITNNTIQGTTVSTTASCLVLGPDGRPTDGTGGTPDSPLRSGGLLGAGWGITLDRLGQIWVGNFGWGGVNPTPDGNGSVSLFLPDGTPLSPPTGFQGGPVRVQGMASDSQGDLWLCSFGTDEVYVFPGGDPDRSFSFQLPARHGPFGIALADDDTAWVANFTSVPGSVFHLRKEGNTLQEIRRREFGLDTKGLAIDSLGNIWVPSGGTNSIFLLSPTGAHLGEFSGGAIDGPWSVAIDGRDNVWVSNFGPLRPGSVYEGTLTHLAGANPATRPPGTQTGDVLSPPNGYRVRTAGEPVLLHDGSPLYGPGAPPAFTPMMRITSAVIDPAGNVWAANNWKPDFDVDLASNPPGDGMVIFVGIADPVLD